VELNCSRWWAIRQARHGGQYSTGVSPTGKCFPSGDLPVPDPEGRPIVFDNPVSSTVVRQVKPDRDQGRRVILGQDGAVRGAGKDILVGWQEKPTRRLRPVQSWAALEWKRDES
jgi:hypothetical protein